MSTTGEARLDPARVAALVPCHREPPGPDLLSRIAAAVGQLVVVDDHGPAALQDKLSRVVTEAGGTLVRSSSSHGKGSAIAAGIEWLRSNGDTDAVLVMDSDGQHPPDVIPRFLLAAGRADLVIGDRLDQPDGMPRLRRFANGLASRLLAARTGSPVQDSQCGMRVLRGRALSDVPPLPGGYEAESDHLKRCLLAGVSVEWVTMPALYDGEPSDFRALADGTRVWWTLVR